MTKIQQNKYTFCILVYPNWFIIKLIASDKSNSRVTHTVASWEGAESIAVYPLQVYYGDACPAELYMLVGKVRDGRNGFQVVADNLAQGSCACPMQDADT